MNALIFGNGEFKNKDLLNKFLKLEDIFIIGVDGGCDFLIENRTKINLAIGDFDSTKYKNNLGNISKKLKTNMGLSDLEFSIDYCINAKFDRIYLFGFTGKRSDHFLFNLKCMYKAFRNNIDISMIDEFNVIKLSIGEKIFDRDNFKFFSIIPVYDDTVVSINGSKYDLYNERINLFTTLTLSNEWEKEKVKIYSSKLIYVSLVF